VSGEAPSSNTANAATFPPKHLQSLRGMLGAWGSLQRAVDGADAAPSPDARQGYARLRPLAESTLAAWRRFMTVDLAALNDWLRTTGRKPIVTGR